MAASAFDLLNNQPIGAQAATKPYYCNTFAERVAGERVESRSRSQVPSGELRIHYSTVQYGILKSRLEPN